jgi:hypothetical protein
MGLIIKAKCNHCSFTGQNLLFGGGFSNFIDHCGFPLLDRESNNIIIGNVLDREAVKRDHPDYAFYDEEQMSRKDLQHEEASIEWTSYRLFNDGYFCPKCHQFTLGFLMEGFYD